MSAARTRGRGREEVGVVLSDRMDKTIVVVVERASAHPLYQKVVRVRHKFVAHDEENDCRTGDRVRIAECRPMSRRKRWRVVEVVERAPDA
ncbi:MAG: 30S ribosomal protein S17 [Acidobacteria bacterium]|nr:30S ribosomal protein S17 [Acidobacteriota bacterium]